MFVCLIVGSLLITGVLACIPMYTMGTLRQMLSTDLRSLERETGRPSGQLYFTGKISNNDIGLSRVKGLEKMKNTVVGGAIPKEYIPAVDAGIQSAMQSGVLAGYNVVDVKVNLYDGSYHEVDSSELAFKIAGSMAFKDAMKKADPVLTEPIMKVSVVSPDEYMGNVVGDINSRRGQIYSQEVNNGTMTLTAFVPLSEMFGYATELRSRTQGRGSYSMEPDHFAEVPKSLQEKLSKS